MLSFTERSNLKLVRPSYYFKGFSETKMSLQERQRNLIANVLDISAKSEDGFSMMDNDSSVGRWKVLIYTLQQIVPLFSNTDLRKHGITLHLLISDRREPISGVPAVYYVEPTEDNIRRIVKDCSSPIYEVNYINFSSCISRDLMALFVQLCVDNNCSQRISRVYDCFLGGIALEPTLFTFQKHHVYSLINNRLSVATEIENMVENVLPKDLLSLVVSMASVPIIRCSVGSAANAVSSKLFGLIRDQLKSAQNVFQQNKTNNGPCLRHPLLVIIDRDVDLFPAVHHSSYYQPLVNDLLPSVDNRVIISNDTSFYLDKNQDIFWNDYAYLSFPVAIKANGDGIKEVENKTAAIRGTVNESNGKEGIQSNLLRNVVDSIPELQNLKSQFEKHTKILGAVMEQIKYREIAAFSTQESCLKNDQGVDAAAIAELLKSKGTIEDKVRLLCICAICKDKEFVQQMEGAIHSYLETLSTRERSTADEMMKAYMFVKSNCMPKSQSERNLAAADSSIRGSFFRATTGIINLAKAGVKGMLGDDERSLIVQIVDELVTGKSTSLTESYGYYEPSTGRTIQPNDGSKYTFEDIIVFVVGGGNYIEYQSLQVYAKSQNPPRVVLYGSDDILSAKQFIPELQQSYVCN